MTLGERICFYRTQQQLSQSALAEQLEVSRQSVSKWENDASIPELDKLIQMSNLFAISLDTLVKGTTDEQAAEQEDEEAKTQEEAPSESAQGQPPQLQQPLPQKNLPISKIIALVIFGCGLLGCMLSLFLAPDLLFLFVPISVMALLYFIIKQHPGLWCGWITWLLLYYYLPRVTGISFTWVFLPGAYRQELAIHTIIAWVDFLALVWLIAATVYVNRKRIWKKKTR